MIAFGSKKTYGEWRYTRRVAGKRKVHRDGWLEIKSRKAGRRWDFQEQIQGAE